MAANLVITTKRIYRKVESLYGPLGKRVKRKRRTTGLDLCTGCYAFHCDPWLMSEKFRQKVDRRLKAGLCVGCGHKPCTCKRKGKRL